jgi:uncharacterized protein YkwD
LAFHAHNAFAASPKSNSSGSSVQQTDQQLAAMVDRVHRLVNEFRAGHQRAPLSLDPMIGAEAREHSAEIARNPGGIGHRGFDQRVKDTRSQIPHRAAAENVAINFGHEDPAHAAVQGWIESPPHRKNLLGDFSLTRIGIARDARGGYFCTQIFVQPR